MRWFLFIVFAALAAITAYGAFALMSKGGGVLLFLAAPLALIAWILFMTLDLPSLSPWSAEAQAVTREEATEVMVTWRADLQARVDKLSARLERGWMLPDKRRALERELEESKRLLARFDFALRNGKLPDART